MQKLILVKNQNSKSGEHYHLLNHLKNPTHPRYVQVWWNPLDPEVFICWNRGKPVGKIFTRDVCKECSQSLMKAKTVGR